MRYFILTFFMLFVIYAPVFAADDTASLRRELQKLEAELPDILAEGTDLDTRQDYVDRVLKLRAKLEDLEEGADAAGEKHAPEDRVLIFKGFYLYEDSEYVPHPYAGKTITQCSYNECGKNVDIRTRTTIDTYPLRIKPGEPFSISASTEAQKVKHAGMNLGDWETTAVANTSISAYDGPSASVKGSSALLDYGYGYTGSFDADAKSALTIDFVYKGYDKETPSAGTYEYEVSKIKKDGEFTGAAEKKDPTGEIQRMDYNEREEEKGDKHHQYGFKFTVNGLTAIYDWGNTDDKPADVKALPEEEPLVAKEAEGKSETESTAQENRSREQKDPLQLAEDMMNETLINDPKERKKHIKYWIKNAEPLENARPGSNLKYEKWGRIEGKVSGLGTIVVSGKPDDAEGWFPDPYEYVWAKADTLDSLNLCTLREYVERKIKYKETETCQKDAAQHPEIASDNSVPDLISRQAKRYVIMPDVVGMAYEKAAKELSKQGLQAVIGMTFKPQSDDEAGKVISQQATVGSKIEKGSDVVIDIAMGGNKVDMPDVVGMPYKDAARKLISVGLKPKYIEGPYPHKADLSEKVIKASLTPPIKIMIGAEIELTAYKKYSATNAPAEPASTYSSNWGSPSAPQKQEKIVKSDPASAFGGKSKPQPSKKGDFKCDVGLGLRLEASGRKYPDRKNGILKTDALGEKNYICRYNIDGKQRIFLGSYFDKEPTTADGKRLKTQMCSVYGLTKWGKAMFINLENTTFAKAVGAGNVAAFTSYHLDQIAPKAISCSGGNGSVSSNTSPPPASNKTRGGPANPNVPASFSCNSGVSSMKIDNWYKNKNGKYNSYGSKNGNYVCEYDASSGKDISIVVNIARDISYLDSSSPASSPYKKKKDYCQEFTEYSGNRAVYVYLNGYQWSAQTKKDISNTLGSAAADQFLRFHIGQIAQYAAPCN